MRLEKQPSQAWWSQARMLPLLLWTMAVVAAVSTAMSLLLLTQVRVLGPGDDPADRMARSWLYLASGTGFVWLITGVVWFAWQHGLARLLEAQTDLPRTPLQQLGAWLLPPVCWWWPLQDLRRLHELLAPGGRAGFEQLSRRWWSCWLVFQAVSAASTWVVGYSHGAAGARAGFLVTAIAGLSCLPAAVLGARVVREVTDRVAGATP